MPVVEPAPASGNGRGTGPAVPVVTPPDNREAEPEVPHLVNEVGDDRDNIRPGDRMLLIVENDLGFARVLLDTAREHGFKGLVTSLGAAALAMAREYKPAAITLDIFLPDIEGWRVLERLKNDVLTRHVPVCVISTDEARERALNSGAMAFVPKPIKTQALVDELVDHLKNFGLRSTKNLLVVERNEARREQIVSVLDADDVRLIAVPDGAAAVDYLRGQVVDCLVVGPDLADLDLAEFGDESGGDGMVRQRPVIVFEDGGSADGQEGVWKKLADVCTVRRVQSPERLLDQAALFLHRDVSKLPEAKRRLLQNLHSSDKVLPGKKVLIVDDDMRNIFALSTVLEDHEMAIVSADNGRDAIRILQEQPDVDIVLMDIMMPEMDGIDTMREIRKIVQLKTLPIIAVTAKAMKGDREKCIEAGAWDYLSKPVDTEQMLAVLRAWLHR
jgi:CheY-like chemotaxis protein